MLSSEKNIKVNKIMKRGYEAAMDEDRYVRHRTAQGADSLLQANTVGDVANGGPMVICLGNNPRGSDRSGAFSSGDPLRPNALILDSAVSPSANHGRHYQEFRESPSLLIGIEDNDNVSIEWLDDEESSGIGRSYDGEHIMVDRFASMDMLFRNINLYSVSYDGRSLCLASRGYDARANEIELEDLTQGRSFHNIEILGYSFTFEVYGEQRDFENFAGYRLIDMINFNIEAYSATGDIQDLVRDLPGDCMF